MGELGALFGGAKPTKALMWRRDCAHMLLQNLQFCGVKAESELSISMICGGGTGCGAKPFRVGMDK